MPTLATAPYQMLRTGDSAVATSSRRFKHRPALSLDARIIRQSQQETSAALRSAYMPDSKVPISVKSSPASPLKRARKWSSFVKLVKKDEAAASGSDTDTVPLIAAHRDHSTSLSDASSATTESQARSNASSILPSHARSLSMPSVPCSISSTAQSIDQGALLTHMCIGGAKIQFLLGRHIQYRIAPAVASAWSYCDTASAPASSFGSGPSQQDPFGDSSAARSVPRSLLCFTLDVEPYKGEPTIWPRENFEHISITIDFGNNASNLPSKLLRSVSSPTGTSFVKSDNFHSYKSANLEQRSHLEVTQKPIVRGFAACDLTSSGFLQSFGPILYEGHHDKLGKAAAEAVIVGEGLEQDKYRSFEKRLARSTQGEEVEGDKITVTFLRNLYGSRNHQAGTSSSVAFGDQALPVSPGAHTNSDNSAICITLKRDTSQQATWSHRKIPFLVLLEHPPSVPVIDALVQVDMTTIRQSVCKSEIPLEPSSTLSSPRSSHDKAKGAKESYISRKASQLLSRKSKASLSISSLSMSKITSPTTSLLQPSMAGRAEEIERNVRIFPRRDPVSVITCGQGNVQDILFSSGVTAKAKSKVSSSLESVQDSAVPQSTSTVQAGTTSSPSISLLSSKGSTSYWPSSSKPSYKPSLRHAHSQSAQITPGMFKRSGTIGKVERFGSEVVPKSPTRLYKHIDHSYVHDKGTVSACPSPVTLSWASPAIRAPPPTLVERELICMTEARSTKQVDHIYDMFDMVMTNAPIEQQNKNFDPRTTWALPLPGGASYTCDPPLLPDRSCIP